MMNELTLHSALHSILAVARVVDQLRAAVVLIQAATGEPETPYKVDGLDASTLEHLVALAEAMRTLEGTVSFVRRQRAARAQAAPAADVSRETWPAPFADEGDES